MERRWEDMCRHRQCSHDGSGTERIMQYVIVTKAVIDVGLASAGGWLIEACQADDWHCLLLFCEVGVMTGFGEERRGRRVVFPYLWLSLGQRNAVALGMWRGTHSHYRAVDSQGSGCGGEK